MCQKVVVINLPILSKIRFIFVPNVGPTETLEVGSVSFGEGTEDEDNVFRHWMHVWV